MLEGIGASTTDILQRLRWGMVGMVVHDSRNLADLIQDRLSSIELSLRKPRLSRKSLREQIAAASESVHKLRTMLADLNDLDRRGPRHSTNVTPDELADYLADEIDLEIRRGVTWRFLKNAHNASTVKVHVPTLMQTVRLLLETATRSAHDRKSITVEAAVNELDATALSFSLQVSFDAEGRDASAFRIAQVSLHELITHGTGGFIDFVFGSAMHLASINGWDLMVDIIDHDTASTVTLKLVVPKRWL